MLHSISTILISRSFTFAQRIFLRASNLFSKYFHSFHIAKVVAAKPKIMITTIVIFQFLLESSTSNLHWSISLTKVVAFVSFGCKPSKVTMNLGYFVDLACEVLFILARLSLKLTHSRLLFAALRTKRFIRNLILWPLSGLVLSPAVQKYTILKSFSVLNPQQLSI